MARKRLYESNAARQAAYRSRRKKTGQDKVGKIDENAAHQAVLFAMVGDLQAAMLRAARRGDSLAVMTYENSQKAMLYKLIHHFEVKAAPERYRST